MDEAHREGIRVGIVTTGSKAGVEALIGQDSAFAEAVDIIAASEAVEMKKPAPDVYIWLLQRLGLSSMECVAIEDSSVGLHAAVAASIPTITTVSDYTTHDDFDGALAVVSSLGDSNVLARSLAGLRPESNVVNVAFLRGVHREAETGIEEQWFLDGRDLVVDERSDAEIGEPTEPTDQEKADSDTLYRLQLVEDDALIAEGRAAVDVWRVEQETRKQKTKRRKAQTLGAIVFQAPAFHRP